MTDFLARLGTLSLGGGVAVLLLIGAGRMSRNRYAARWRCRAWSILCLLMILPVPMFALPNPVKTPSTLIRLQLPADHAVSNRPTLETGERQPDPQDNGGHAAGNPASPTGTTSAQSPQRQSTPQVSQVPQTPAAAAVHSFSVPAMLLGPLGDRDGCPSGTPRGRPSDLLPVAQALDGSLSQIGKSYRSSAGRGTGWGTAPPSRAPLLPRPGFPPCCAAFSALCCSSHRGKPMGRNWNSPWSMS